MGKAHWTMVWVIVVGVSLAVPGEVLVYPHLLDPRAHPDDARRAVKPPSWETFENETQFVSLRAFGQQDGKAVGFEEEMEKYTVTFGLGRVVWPTYDLVFAKNAADVAAAVKRRGLWLFDPWGYVPGSGPGEMWQQFVAPAETLRAFEETLGERWLGMDVGEQDGRYIGGYATQSFPVSGDRWEQYLNFQRHFEQMGDDLGQKLSALNSLNYAHALLKEGTYTLIGSETAQALPSSPVVYAFNRGAGKQYGVPWFGNASVFNRWGWKTYGAEGKQNGPTKGTSLNLLKRLLYSHILYNSVFVGFESSWFDGEALSPIGRIQQSAQTWLRAHGPVGVMHTPVALLIDFASGWTFPRHLYTSDTYRVWGALPYGAGDHFTDAVLELIYPGYVDASYFRDERGFMSPTPYGDIADVLLSDAAPWVLGQYGLVIAAGALTPGAEVRDTLAGYVRGGGHLVITEGNRAALGLNTDDPGAGRFSVIPGDMGVERDGSVLPPVKSLEEHALGKPYALTPEARKVLDAALREQVLFDAGPELALITCRKAAGRYTLGVFNNTLAPKPFRIVSHCGELVEVKESALDTSERGAVGEFPEGLAPAQPLASDTEIAPGSLRIFDVTVREQGVRELPAAAPGPAPRGRALPLGNPASLKEAVLRRPTFSQHFDGVVVDWRYLETREADALAGEARWLKRQGFRIYVDARSGINLYPDLRLTNNDPVRSPESLAVLARLMDKMGALGAKELILSLHRQPENSFPIVQTRASFVESLKTLSAEGAKRGITLLLAQSDKFGAGLDETAGFVRNAGAENLRLAPSLALLARQGRTPENVAPELRALVGLWLVSSAGVDVNGKTYSTSLPAAGTEVFTPWRDALQEAPLALDAVYPNADAEYADARLVEGAR